jgi:ribosome-associated protein
LQREFSTRTHIGHRNDIRASSLPAAVKDALLALPGRRVNKDGVLVIKAQASRSQDENRAAALARLQALVDEAAQVPTPRKPTRPTYGAKQRRLKEKSARSEVKAARGKVQAGG